MLIRIPQIRARRAHGIKAPWRNNQVSLLDSLWQQLFLQFPNRFFYTKENENAYGEVWSQRQDIVQMRQTAIITESSRASGHNCSSATEENAYESALLLHTIMTEFQLGYKYKKVEELAGKHLQCTTRNSVSTEGRLIDKEHMG